MRVNPKTFLIACAILLSFTTTYAQPKFRAGLIVGLNGSQISGDNMAGFNKGGLLAGLYVDYPFNEYWSGGFEMLFNMKGSKDSSGGIGTWVELELGYIEIPLIVKCHLNKKFELYGGPTAGYLMYSVFYPKGSGLGGTETADFLKKYDFGACIGFTYNFADHFSATLRYENSLVTFGTGTANSVYSGVPVNTGLLNIVATGGIYYHFFSNKL